MSLLIAEQQNIRRSLAEVIEPTNLYELMFISDEYVKILI